MAMAPRTTSPHHSRTPHAPFRTTTPFLPGFGMWLNAPLAVAVSIMAMQLTDTLHPPAAATAMIAAATPVRIARVSNSCCRVWCEIRGRVCKCAERTPCGLAPPPLLEGGLLCIPTPSSHPALPCRPHVPRAGPYRPRGLVVHCNPLSGGACHPCGGGCGWPQRHWGTVLPQTVVVTRDATWVPPAQGAVWPWT